MSVLNQYMLGKNPLQGKDKRVLFVCTGGILRSATGAHWAAKEKGWNTRSCGILDESIPPIHKNLLEWADVIYCMEPEHMDFIRNMGWHFVTKSTMLEIPDNYRYMDPDLIKIFERRLGGT